MDSLDHNQEWMIERGTNTHYQKPYHSAHLGQKPSTHSDNRTCQNGKALHRSEQTSNLERSLHHRDNSQGELKDLTNDHIEVHKKEQDFLGITPIDCVYQRSHNCSHFQ